MSAKRSERAGVYGRQSKDKTKSIDEQTTECEADALALGWLIAERYSDGVSASRFAKKARKGWERLLADVDAGKLDVLVLWESSRGDRTLTTWSALLDLCRERGVLIRVTSHGRTYAMTNERDWRTLAEDGVDSAYESGKTSTRMKRAVAAQAKDGRPHGPVIYGYTRDYGLDPQTAKRVLLRQRAEPKQAPIVREIFARVAKGEAVAAIVRDLNARGIPSPTGREWGRNTVRGIALQVAYTGQRKLRGELYKAMWPALVKDQQYLTCRRILTDPARVTSKPGKQKWLLSYLARSECGDWLIGKPEKTRLGSDKGHLKARYECRKQGSGCVSVVAGTIGDPDSGLDAFVTKLVVGRLAKLDGPSLAPSDDAAILAAREEVATLQGRLEEWRESARRGETSPASLASIEAGLTKDIADARRRTTPTRPAALDEVLDGATGRADIIAKRFAALPVTSKREIIKVVMAIRVRRVSTPGRHTFAPERVEIEWL